MSIGIENTLRETLSSSASALDLPDDPVPGFVTREKRHRRNRRTFRLCAAGLAVAVAGVAFVPRLSSPAPSVGPAPGPSRTMSPLSAGPPRGSLIGDKAFLDDFRATFRGMSEDDKIDRAAVRFLFAGDLPGVRLVVVDVPTERNGRTSWQLQIFDGKQGGEVVPDGSSNVLGDSRDRVVGQAMTSDLDPGYAFVLGPADSKVRITRGFSYGADGRIHRNAEVITGTGLATMVIPPVPGIPDSVVFATVTSAGGETLYDGQVGAGSAVAIESSEELKPNRGVTDAMVQTALAGRSFDRANLAAGIASSLGPSKLHASQVRIEVPWLGVIAGQPAAMWTLQPAGGGLLTFLSYGDMAHAEARRLLQPVADAGKRPLGFRMISYNHAPPTDQVAIVAPGATAVAIEIEGRSPTPLRLDATGFAMATIPPDATAHVSATVGGRQLRTKVPAYSDSIGGLPGEDESTSILD